LCSCKRNGIPCVAACGDCRGIGRRNSIETNECIEHNDDGDDGEDGNIFEIIFGC